MNTPDNPLRETLFDFRPTLAAPLTGHESDQFLIVEAGKLDVAEYRIDLFDDNPVTDARTDFLSNFRLATMQGGFAHHPATLATIRSETEGGKWPAGLSDFRFGIYAELTELVDGFDVEVSALKLLNTVAEMALISDKVTIGSFHDFESTPPEKELLDIIARAENNGAEATKLAVQINTKDDLTRLTEFTQEHSEAHNLVVVGMGEAYGPASRYILPAAGSLMTFAAGETATAVGQPAIDELRESLFSVTSDMIDDIINSMP